MRKPRYYYESNFCHVMVQGDEKNLFLKIIYVKTNIYII